MLAHGRRRASGLGLSLILAMTSACAAARPATGTIDIVASTDVYGAIAAEIGGAYVKVTALINSSVRDPHSFEANAHDLAAVSRADVVIENGAGYDGFMTRLRNAAGRSDASLIDVVRLSGKRAVDGHLNEHVWYDLGTVQRLARRLAAALSRKDPRHAQIFLRDAAEFKANVTALQRSEAQLAATYRGQGVAVTEPVPRYLLDACGLVDKTPAQFTAAVEEETGVPVAALQQTLALIRTHAVRLLVYNSQTSGPETDTVVAAAKQAGVPLVGVTETLPAGMSFVGWMSGTLAALRSALATAGRS